MNRIFIGAGPKLLNRSDRNANGNVNLDQTRLLSEWNSALRVFGVNRFSVHKMISFKKISALMDTTDVLVCVDINLGTLSN